MPKTVTISLEQFNILYRNARNSADILEDTAREYQLFLDTHPDNQPKDYVDCIAEYNLLRQTLKELEAI